MPLSDFSSAGRCYQPPHVSCWSGHLATDPWTVSAGDTGPVLVHADDGRVDHLHRRIMVGAQSIHDTVPHASPSPANEAIVASRARPKTTDKSRHGAPDRKTQKMPLRTRRSFTRGLVRQEGFDGSPFKIGGRHRQFAKAHRGRCQYPDYLRFPGEADIDWQPGLAENVANDPNATLA